MRDLYRELVREGRLPDDVADAAAVLMTAYEASPLGRAMDIALVRLVPGGGVYGVSGNIAAPVAISDGRALPIDERSVASPRLRARLSVFTGKLSGGLVLFHDGDSDAEPARRLSREEARKLADRERKDKKAQEVAEELVDAAAKRARNKHADDLFALVLLAA